MPGAQSPTPYASHLLLNAFAVNHESEVLDRGLRCRADLIGVGHHGARLRFPEREIGRAWSAGHPLVLNMRIAASEGATENLACAVRWVQADEMGVDFRRPLEVGVYELQTWLDN